MRPSACNNNFFDQRLARAARFTFATVDPMLYLEEAGFTISVNIIRNGGSPGSNSSKQHFTECGMQFLQFFSRKRMGTATRLNTGVRQTFISINIANAVQKFLVQQSSFNRG